MTTRAFDQASSGIESDVPQLRQTQIFSLACSCATRSGLKHTGQFGTISQGFSVATTACFLRTTLGERVHPDRNVV